MFSAALHTLSERERLVLSIFIVLFMLSALVIVSRVNNAFLVEIPATGGSITEGVIGSPRFINPLLANSDTDRDLTALVYSGLMRATGSGTLVPDIAESYTVSDDGTVYTFVLKKDLTWQDGEKITADDVLFTIQKAQDSVLRSPRRASWDGVGVEKIDERTIQFTLPQPYAPFLENTTMGILPEHIWGNVNAEEFVLSKYNTEPIGSGPYMVKSIERDRGGIPTLYTLVPFDDFALGKPYIKTIGFRFYSTEERLSKAFEDGDVDSINSISPEIGEALKEHGYRVMRSPLPRVFGVFLNQNNASVFTDRHVRKALNEVIDRNQIIQTVLKGYGTAIDGPIPPGTLGYLPIEPNNLTKEERIAAATSTLKSAGWTIDEETGKMTDSKGNVLRFSLSTSAIPELKEVATELQGMWSEIGIDVDVKVFEPGNLNQAVIRPRDYDALLFGEIIGRDSDPFAFWHSSQRLDPGLNIALYTNITADKLLEKARAMTDEDKRREAYEEFNKEVVSDIPAFFLYSPDFIYVLPKELKGVNLGALTVPSERFLNVYEWHINTDRVWKFFTDE